MTQLKRYTLTAAIALPYESRVEFVRKFTALAKEYGEFYDSVLKPAPTEDVDVEAYVKPAQVQVDEIIAEYKTKGDAI